jgi:hypothetical protein
MNTKHIHRWKDTGKARYTCPAEYEQKCKCGKIRWEERGASPTIKLTEEEMQRKYPGYSIPPFWEKKL